MRHRRPPGPAIASGTRSGDRSDRADPLWSRRPTRSPVGQAPLSIDCWREPRSRSTSPRLRAAKSCLLDVMVLRLSVPVAGPRGKEEGENPRAVDQIGARSPGRWSDASRSTAPAPQSKPVAPASRLVAQVAPSVVLGFGLRILASEPARVRLYSDRGRLCAQTSKAMVRELSPIPLSDTHSMLVKGPKTPFHYAAARVVLLQKATESFRKAAGRSRHNPSKAVDRPAYG
jgi:hypothetical protein